MDKSDSDEAKPAANFQQPSPDSADASSALFTHAYVSKPAPCPYLPNRTEQRVLVPLAPEPNKAQAQLSFFTRLGFRRSQNFLYRPNCAACQLCVSYRLVVADFKPSVTQVRVARRNQDLWWQRENNPNLLSLYGLFARYQLQRHTDSAMAQFSYADFLMLLENPAEGQQHGSGIYTLSRSTQDYLGAMLVDEVADGLSAVYSFYDPKARARSLGTELIMRLVAEAGRRQLPYVYLGYWVAGSQKMDYKARFGPAEILTENGWVTK